MSFLAILLAATSLAWLFGRRASTARDIGRRGLAAAMVLAGITHFTNTGPFVAHMPDWVPGRDLVVYLSGIVEVVFGGALISLPKHRKVIGRLLAAYLLSVFPANIYVAVADVEISGLPGGAWSWIRLPLQLLFVAWALWSTAGDAAPAEVSRTGSHPDSTRFTTMRRVVHR